MSSDSKDDEYVAKLLAEDARKSSIRYSNVGLSALLPKRPTGAAPKPNTRFLQAIVKEVSNHNAALKKKEELEAQIRMRQLKGDHSLRDLDADYERERRRKRMRLDEDGLRDRHGSSRHRRRNSSSEGSRSRSRDRDDQHKKQKRYRDLDTETGSRARTDGTRRIRSRDRDQKPSRRVSRKDHKPSTSPPARGVAGIGNGYSKGEVKESSPPRRRYSPSSSSDPLEAVVGPIPQSNRTPEVLPRGRGAFKSKSGASNIDAHFSSNYNPSQDIDQSPNSDVEDQEDWDMALEALRDRRAWQQKQASRLKEAGFTDKEIKKWEENKLTTKSDAEDIAQVRWSRKGEAREWDKGKTIPSSEDEKESDIALDKAKSTRDQKPRTVGTAWENKNNAFVKNFRKALG